MPLRNGLSRPFLAPLHGNESTMAVIVGLDWTRCKHDCLLMTAEGQILEHGRITHGSMALSSTTIALNHPQRLAPGTSNENKASLRPRSSTSPNSSASVVGVGLLLGVTQLPLPRPAGHPNEETRNCLFCRHDGVFRGHSRIFTGF